MGNNKNKTQQKQQKQQKQSIFFLMDSIYDRDTEKETTET